jgi:4-aminobutyrate aminotransferase / (S)-3-amino-2-methylpropionate transaminase / 5-aminovalerate transaminase
MSSEFGRQLPSVVTAPPGPRSLELGAELSRYECPNITYLAEDFPIFWDSAHGANVRDVDGNVYVDLTAAFAVTAAGHGHPRIVAAIADQAGRLLHGMGDVHPPAVKVELLRKLAEIAPGKLNRSILANSGAEAIEGALKTMAIATGKPRVLAFERSYHGLTLGAVSVSGRDDFKAPFTRQLGRTAVFAPYPYAYRSSLGEDPDAARHLAMVESILDSVDPAEGEIGGILAEPIQGRGGDIVPPDEWLPGLRRICDDRGLLLILDEIYTGFGRTGRWFACQHWGVEPDVLVVGKALTGGLPFAACIGSDAVMEAWPRSTGEALHTSTFLGHPLGCAAALASMEVLRDERLIERSAELGAYVRAELGRRIGDHPRVGEIRGMGLMIGVEVVKDRKTREPDPELVGLIMIEALRRGFLVLGGGIHSNVLSLSPPLSIERSQVDAFLSCLESILQPLRMS